jgi:hypothetical protein
MFYIVAILATLLTMPAKAQGADPLVGTWKLNPEKTISTIRKDQRVKSQVLHWTSEGQNFVNSTDTVKL